MHMSKKTMVDYEIDFVEALPSRSFSHGIVFNPKTGKEIVRPGRIGDIRFVRIETRGQDRPAYDALGLALDILYDDVRTATRDASIPRTVGRTDDEGVLRLAVAKANVEDMIRPVAARIEDGWVSIWVEMSKDAWRIHADRGLHPLGAPIGGEPRIDRDAVVIKGKDMAHQFALARDRIEAAHRRQALARIAARRAFRRKAGLTTSIVGIVLLIAMGATATGSLLVGIMVAACMTIMHYSVSEHATDVQRKAVKASLQPLLPVAAPRAEKPAPGPDAVWAEVRDTVTRNAPKRIDEVRNAMASIERLEDVSTTGVDADVEDRIASVNGGVRSLLDSYRATAALADDDEATALAGDLADALVNLGRTANETRRQALRRARDAFDTQRRYLETRSEHPLLSPVC